MENNQSDWLGTIKKQLTYFRWLPDFASVLALERNLVEGHGCFGIVPGFGKWELCHCLIDLATATTAIAKWSAIFTFMLMTRMFISKFRRLTNPNHITFFRVSARQTTLHDNVQGEYDAGPFQFCKYKIKLENIDLYWLISDFL